MIARRSFLRGIIAACAAPAIAKAGVLMPIKPELGLKPPKLILSYAEALAASMRETREILAANILNDAYLTGLGVARLRYVGGVIEYDRVDRKEWDRTTGLGLAQLHAAKDQPRKGYLHQEYALSFEVTE